MTATHLHLLLNHVPVLGTAFGLVLLLYGFLRTSDDVKKAALWVFILVALVAVPVYLTGEPAEDVVKPLPGVSKAIIEQHEEAAEVAFTGVEILGVIALVGLFLGRRNRSLSTGFGVIMIVASLTVSGLMAWTANLGGQIRHSEIRSGTSPAATTGQRDRD